MAALTGFPGTGTTRLPDRILPGPQGRKHAVSINAFGETGIDEDPVIDADEEIFGMKNGRFRGRLRGDLIRIPGGRLKRREFGGILIGTTGMADPAPVARTLDVDQDAAVLWPLYGAQGPSCA